MTLQSQKRNTVVFSTIGFFTVVQAAPEPQTPIQPPRCLAALREPGGPHLCPAWRRKAGARCHEHPPPSHGPRRARGRMLGLCLLFCSPILLQGRQKPIDPFNNRQGLFYISFPRALLSWLFSVGASSGQHRLSKGRVSSYTDLMLIFTCPYSCLQGLVWAWTNATQAVPVTSKPEELLVSIRYSIPFRINLHRRHKRDSTALHPGSAPSAPWHEGSRKVKCHEAQPQKRPSQLQVLTG